MLSAYFTSKQILPFDFAEQTMLCISVFSVRLVTFVALIVELRSALATSRDKTFKSSTRYFSTAC